MLVDAASFETPKNGRDSIGRLRYRNDLPERNSECAGTFALSRGISFCPGNSRFLALSPRKRGYEGLGMTNRWDGGAHPVAFRGSKAGRNINWVRRLKYPDQ